MKKKEKLNYMLRAVYNNEDYLMKDLKSYCMIHKVVDEEEEFNVLLDYLREKGYVTVNREKQTVLFRKPLVRQGIAAGVFYNGTTMQIFFDPYRTNIQPII